MTGRARFTDHDDIHDRDKGRRARPRGDALQIAAWEALSEIPYGETRTYAEQAVHLGRPNAVRAIGAANGRNPISIVLPCHRVVGSDGSLTGFAGGLEAKAWLLALDAARSDAPGPG